MQEDIDDILLASISVEDGVERGKQRIMKIADTFVKKNAYMEEIPMDLVEEMCGSFEQRFRKAYVTLKPCTVDTHPKD